MVNSIKETFESFKNAIQSVINKISEFFGLSGREFSIGLPTGAFSGFAETVSNAIGKLKEFLSFDGKSVSVSGSANIAYGAQTITPYAAGGFPESASLFWAGENGVPEILGTVGGRTAVAGGNEITGIREAVYDSGNVQAQLLSTAVGLLQIIAEKDFDVQLDGRSVVEGIKSREKRNGYSFN